MENATDTHNDVSLNTSQNYEVLIPVPVLAKELDLYKISDYILKYCAVPIAVWGCTGNFFSFR